MSISVLTQVYEETRRLAIAGSVVAPGDFRLKKLIAPLEQSGQKAPVFARVAQAVTKVVNSDEQNSAEALLDLSTLVNAVLYTQGETGTTGPLEDIRTNSLGQHQTQTSARILKPLIEALTTKGSGRLEIIKDAQERGDFKDLRLINPALAALDDNFAEIADLIVDKVLPLYGKAILPQLRDKINLKGRAGHVRRLQLLHQLDPDGARDYVKRALDEGSKEMRVQAIECLGHAPEDLVFLAEQAKSKAKDVRTAALRALGNSPTADAATILSKAVEGGDLELAVQPVQISQDPVLMEFVLRKAEEELNALLSSKESDSAKRSKAVQRVLCLLECLRGRADTAAEDFLLHAFALRERLAQIKGDPGGTDIFERIVSVMSESSGKVLTVLVDSHKSLRCNELVKAFLGACRTKTPAEVFDIFGPYLAVTVDARKKKTDPAAEKRQAIAGAILAGSTTPSHAHRIRTGRRDGDHFDHDLLRLQFDPRWLNLAIDAAHTELVIALAKPGHEAASRFLMTSFEQQLARPNAYDFWHVLQAIVRIQHPEATNAVIKTIVKHSKSTTYGLWWVGRLIPELPKSALPQLEAMMTTLPEKRIEELIDFVTQLKNKP